MATLAAISAELPNGFHDAELCRFDVDYERAELVMALNVDVSDPDVSDDPEYRPLQLSFSGLAFMAIDPPRSTTALSAPKALWIDAGDGQPSTSPVELPPLPESCFLCWFFVSEWSAFIRVAARDAKLR